MHKMNWGREGGGAEKGIPRRSGHGPRSGEAGSREQAEGTSRFSSPGKIGVLSEPPARKPPSTFGLGQEPRPRDYAFSGCGAGAGAVTFFRDVFPAIT
jgi:hypothetical protein